MEGSGRQGGRDDCDRRVLRLRQDGYLAFSWREVGGEAYLCQSSGMAGLKTQGDAEKVLKSCETLAAK